ncbi:MAG: flagellar hook-length control protein FliK [Planctomycetota bacterium]
MASISSQAPALRPGESPANTTQPESPDAVDLTDAFWSMLGSAIGSQPGGASSPVELGASREASKAFVDARAQTGSDGDPASRQAQEGSRARSLDTASKQTTAPEPVVQAQAQQVGSRGTGAGGADHAHRLAGTGRQTALEVEQQALRTPSSIDDGAALSKSATVRGGGDAQATPFAQQPVNTTHAASQQVPTGVPATAAVATQTAGIRATTPHQSSAQAAAGAKAAGTPTISGIQPTNAARSQATGFGRAAPSTPSGRPDQTAALRTQAINGLAAALRQKGGVVTLRLNPEGLGSLRIGMEVSGGKVTATLEATNDAARELLKGDLPQLRSALESRGLVVDRLTVATAERSGVGNQASQDAAADPGHEESEAQPRNAKDGDAGQRGGEGEPGGGAARGEQIARGEDAEDRDTTDADALSEDRAFAGNRGGALGYIEDGGAGMTLRIDAVA